MSEQRVFVSHGKVDPATLGGVEGLNVVICLMKLATLGGQNKPGMVAERW